MAKQSIENRLTKLEQDQPDAEQRANDAAIAKLEREIAELEAELLKDGGTLPEPTEPVLPPDHLKGDDLDKWTAARISTLEREIAEMEADLAEALT